MHSPERGINPDDPLIRQMLARHAVEAIRADIYVSYMRAVDLHHGGLDVDDPIANELQREKSELARAEYPLIPYFWLLHNEDGSVFQQMLEIDKIDPDSAKHPVVRRRTSLNGLHETRGQLLVAIFNGSSREIWRNDYFNGAQSGLLFNHAREIKAATIE